MLTIRVGADAGFDEEESKFVDLGGTVLHLEHSLLSLSKWESKFEKPFLGKEEKTPDEVLEYIKCMNLDPEIPPEVFSALSQENFDEINEYLNAKQSATWFSEQPGAPQTQREVITSELIYYWMTVFKIPFIPAETWNLNRLFTLIRICNLKQEKPKKMSRAEAAQRRRELNEQRKRQLGTSG
jgi:hypothetical protein